MTTNVTQVVIHNESTMNLAQDELVAVAQALQQQLDNDFTPVWGTGAQVSALNPGDPMPNGAWPIRIVDQPDAGLGVHLDDNGQPFAEVQADNNWSLTASHELLEMLADPLGDRLATAPDIDPASDGHAVQYLEEVCDPCEIYSYMVGNITVSDFVLPAFYDATTPAGTAVDFLAKLSGPYDIPSGCYISWQDPQDQRWHQKQPDGTFLTAHQAADPAANPRDDRDQAFGSDEGERRHDLPRILREQTEYVKQMTPA